MKEAFSSLGMRISVPFATFKPLLPGGCQKPRNQNFTMKVEVTNDFRDVPKTCRIVEPPSSCLDDSRMSETS